MNPLHTEVAVQFGCEGESLVGVLSTPIDDERTSDVGVIIVVGGPQYRAGSHRQFVLLARRLADAGFPTLRFDYRGMGDGCGPQLDFQEVERDVAASIGALLSANCGVKRVVLWGLCDGASAALMYVQKTKDPRVEGLGLLNPWVRSEAGLAKAQVKHYYLQRLQQKEFWLKLLRGGTGLRSLSEFAANLRKSAAGKIQPKEAGWSASYQERMAAGWEAFSGSVMLILSGQDLVAKEFLDQVQANARWGKLLARTSVKRHDLPEADHTFSTAAWREQVEKLTVVWLQTGFGESARSAPGLADQ